MRPNLISVIAKLRATSHATRCPCGIRNAVAADVSRLKLLPRRNNERTDVRCYVRICHSPRSKAPAAVALARFSVPRKGWRTPRRFAFVRAIPQFRQVLDCGGPPPLFRAIHSVNRFPVPGTREFFRFQSPKVSPSNLPVPTRRRASEPPSANAGARVCAATAIPQCRHNGWA